MEFSYNNHVNILYIKNSNEKVKESDEIVDGIILDYSENKDIIGVEILNYSNRSLNLDQLIKLDFN